MVSVTKVSVKKLFASAALAVALALTLGAKPAEALPLDLTVDPLDIFFDGTDFGASGGFGGFSILSWVTPSGALGGPFVGTASITWNGATSTGIIDVFDTTNGVQLLLADIYSFANLSMTAPGATWEAYALVQSSTLAFTETVHVLIGSTDFTGVGGTGAADITSVPEPATLALTLVGFGIAAVRARRLRRS